MAKIDLTKSVGFPGGWREKVLRALWSWFIWPSVRFIPRSGSQIRIAALRLFGADVGAGCFIEGGVKILIPWKLIFADYVAIGKNVEIYNYGFVKVGRMTLVSQYSYLCTGTHDFRHPWMPLRWKDIVIGSECWLAAGTWVLPGVTIGDGAVIGARSVVTKDMPSWTVCAGNPCRTMKPRKLIEAE